MRLTLEIHQIVRSNQWFELRTERKSKLNDPSLFKLSLALRFRLTSPLLASLAPNATGSHFNQGNQSQHPVSKQPNGAFLSPQSLHQQQSYQLSRDSMANQAAIRLQCKYRLTEVSDVSFNELILTSTTGPTTKRRAKTSAQIAENEDRDESNIPSARPAELQRRNKQKSPRFAHGRFPESNPRSKFAQLRPLNVLVTKSSQENQVTQKKCPANEFELGSQFRMSSKQAQSEACSMGALVLQPDDPVIVEPNKQLGAYDLGEKLEGEAHFLNRDTDERQLDPKASLQVDCMTIATLSSSNFPHSMVSSIRDSIEEENDSDSSQDINDNDAIDESLGGSSNLASMGYCNDEQTRRRLAVSGKTFNNELTAFSGIDQLISRSTPRSVAAMNLRLAYLNVANSLGRNESDHPKASRQSGEPSGRHGSAKHLAGSTGQPSATTDEAGLHSSADLDPLASISSFDGPNSRLASAQLEPTFLTPPLLEWFINNQEVSRQPTILGSSFSPKIRSRWSDDDSDHDDQCDSSAEKWAQRYMSPEWLATPTLINGIL